MIRSSQTARQRQAIRWTTGAVILPLEPRLMLSSNPGILEDAPGIALAAIVLPAASSATGSTSTVTSSGTLYPLSSIPLLHSNPSASAKIYLDFDGAAAQTWGTYNVPATPAYDQDGDPTTFTDAELASIQQIWARVAEKFSPFNIDVTTENPSSFPALGAMHEIIGGNGGWINSTWGGATYVGGFATGQTTSFIFPQNLTQGDPHDVAEAIAHEMGHAFGLEHQSLYLNGIMANEYNSGDTQSAPIMGRDYSAARGLWWDGPDLDGPTDMQDDLAIIASPHNGFGYRQQDHGQNIATADALTVVGANASAEGVIETTADTDTFNFATGAGTITFNANVARYGPMLDLKLTLMDSAGKVVSVADTTSLGETISMNVPAGIYYLQVASHGSYGDLGQYTIDGTIIPAAQPTVTTSLAHEVSTQPADSATSYPVTVPNTLPVQLTATQKGKKRILLNWSTPAVAVKHIVVQRFVGRKWKTIARLARKASRSMDRNASTTQNNFYRLMFVTTLGAYYSETEGSMTVIGKFT